jgi:hypothetical protein
MGSSYNPAIVTDGLVLCLDAANQRSYPKSGTTWSDLAGSTDGTFSNMDDTNFISDNKGYLVFDGANESVLLNVAPNDLVPTGVGGNGGPATISAWFNSDTVHQGMIFGNGNTNRFYIETYNGPYGYTAHWGFGDTNNATTGSAFIQTGVWYNYTATYDGNTAKGYLNGINTDSSNIYAQVYGGSMKIGQWSGNLYFNGKVASASIYKRALTADEVRQNYEATVGRYI